MNAASVDDAAPRECGFDPTCGSRLPAFYRANPYDDGHRTFFFCSEACRTYFLQHGQIQRRLPPTAPADRRPGAPPIR